MKRCSAQDLQRIYGDAPQELTDHVRQKLSDLSESCPTDERKMSRLRVSLIAAAVALVGLMTVAIATGTIQKWLVVNWKGEVINTREEETLAPSYPDPIYERAAKIMDRYTADRRIEVEFSEPSVNGSTGTMRECQESISSMETFTEKMSASGLTYPVSPPEGYHFHNAEIIYKCSAEGSYLLEEKAEEDGFRYVVWSLPEEYRVIAGYSVNFLDLDGYSVHIDSSLITDDTTMGYAVREESELAQPEMPGFGNALLIVHSDGTAVLNLRRTLETQVKLKGVLPLKPGKTAEIPEYEYTAETIQITWHGESFSSDQIPVIFGMN